jgi:hypothetical protein
VDRCKESVGKQYDFQRTWHLVTSLGIYNLKPYVSNPDNKKVICSHETLEALKITFPEVVNQIEKGKGELDLGKHGTVSI